MVLNMKRLLAFLIILGLLYSAKPYWEKPVSQYMNIDFLDPVDESIEQVLTSKPFVKTVHFVNDSIATITDFIGNIGSNQTDTPIKSEEITNRTDTTKHPEPSIKKPKSAEVAIHNIEIGMSKSSVEELLGKAKDTALNEYGETWHTYHQAYEQFMMVAYDKNDQVTALYTNDDLISTTKGIHLNSSKQQVREQLGEPLSEITRGLTIYVLSEDNDFDVFKIEDAYVYVFYDRHRDHQVTAMQVISETTEEQKQEVYRSSDESLQKGFERQLFHLTNASRVRHQLAPLEWHEQASETAYKHSVDMADHDYFSHQNLQGLSPFDRMRADHISFQSAGENLAYGQASSIFAHEGLMNSAGHRENILQKTYTSLGVGVSFNDEDLPYFTTLFLKPA